MLAASFSRRLRSLTGFTLIELLVVMVIIGILVAIAVPAYLRYEASANDRDAQTALQIAYKAAVAGDTEVNTGKFPVGSTIVQDVKQDEPAANVVSGDCYGTVANAPVKQVLVDPSSTGTQMTLCDRSASGTIWRLTGPLTGTPTLSNGSTVALTFTGNEITDARRAEGLSTTNVPGDSYDGLANDSSTGVWEATTNLVVDGGAEASPAGIVQMNAGATVSKDTTLSRFGQASEKVTTDGTSNYQGVYFRSTGSSMIPVSPNTTYTASVWVNVSSLPPGAQIWLRIAEYDAGGAYVANINGAAGSIISTAGGGWQRLTMTGATGASVTQAVVVVNTNGSYTTTFNVDGVQLEQKPFATPYVETAGATATRQAAAIHAPATLLDVKQGWFVERLRMGFPSSDATNWRSAFALASNDGMDGVDFQWRPGSPRWKMEVLQSATGQSSNVAGAGYTNPGEYVTLIGQWQYISASNRYRLAASVNGSTLAGNLMSVGFVPNQRATMLSIGSSYSGASMQIDGDVLWFAGGTGQLTDADAAMISAWGNTDPSRSSFPAAAQTTIVWDGTSATGSLK